MNRLEKKQLLEIEQIIGIISATLLILAAFTPWGKTDNITLLGIEGNDSKITIVIGLLALVVLWIRGIPTVIALILGITALSVGFYDFQQMSIATAQIGGAVGVGLYVTILAACTVIACSIIDIIRNRKSRSR